MLVAGVDSSTQSTKVVLCDAADGAVISTASAPHPDGTECDPDDWWRALSGAGVGLLDRARAVGVAAQQHGMIALCAAGQVIRPAMLWNDVKSAPQAAALVAELGGAAEWARRTGSVPSMSFTVTKLRWLAEREPGNLARLETVLLPHDWLTWRLGGCAEEPTTDRGDASGTGYFSPAQGRWLPDLAAAAAGKQVRLPRLAAPAEPAGATSWGAVLAPGTGDNMAAALGLGLREGDIVISIGTSGTAFATSAVPSADSTGAVAGFADATGRFLPLVATVNAARVLTVTARLLGTDLAGLSRLALAAQAGAGGLTMLPYLDGERTPRRPGASGVVRGLTSDNGTPENLARAAVEAVLCSLADAIDHLADAGVATPKGSGTAARDGQAIAKAGGTAARGGERRILLIGGGARSEAVRRIAPAIFGTAVTVPDPAEYVALGAARQAAWVLEAGAEPPSWPQRPASDYTAEPADEVRERYATLRDETAGWQ